MSTKPMQEIIKDIEALHSEARRVTDYVVTLVHLLGVEETPESVGDKAPAHVNRIGPYDCNCPEIITLCLAVTTIPLHVLWP